jgi:enoyl-CoA hydratase/carnithine racemase
MPPHLACFMGLTGCQINARDALMVGLADHLIAHSQKERVVSALTEQEWGDESAENARTLTELLLKLDDANGFPISQLRAHNDVIENLVSNCNKDSFLPDFSQGLESLNTDDDWLKRAAATFKAGSPTTAHIVVEQLRRIPELSLGQSFSMELTIAVQCSRHPDFSEGVRALLIDKDNQPGWRYPDLSDVPESWVLEHFEEPWESGNPLGELV